MERNLFLCIFYTPTNLEEEPSGIFVQILSNFFLCLLKYVQVLLVYTEIVVSTADNASITFVSRGQITFFLFLITMLCFLFPEKFAKYFKYR